MSLRNPGDDGGRRKRGGQCDYRDETLYIWWIENICHIVVLIRHTSPNLEIQLPLSVLAPASLRRTTFAAIVSMHSSASLRVDATCYDPLGCEEVPVRIYYRQRHIVDPFASLRNERDIKPWRSQLG